MEGLLKSCSGLTIPPSQRREFVWMLGSKPRDQSEFLIAGSLRDLIPNDHILARVDRVLDLSWLRAEARSCYAAMAQVGPASIRR